MTKMSIKQQEEIIEKEVVDQLVVKKNGDIQCGGDGGLCLLGSETQWLRGLVISVVVSPDIVVRI